MFSLTVPEFLALLSLWPMNEEAPVQPFHFLDVQLSYIHLLIHWQLESKQHLILKFQYICTRTHAHTHTHTHKVKPLLLFLSVWY